MEIGAQNDIFATDVHAKVPASAPASPTTEPTTEPTTDHWAYPCAYHSWTHMALPCNISNLGKLQSEPV